MGIYIKSLEMPISCGDCPCGSIFSGYRCMAEHKEFEKYPLDSRQDWCPLVLVPPHGDLIDRNALLKKCEFVCTDDDEDIRAVRYSVIENAPTIIEAEEGG